MHVDLISFDFLRTVDAAFHALLAMCVGLCHCNHRSYTI